jgi:hypothetical protein
MTLSEVRLKMDQRWEQLYRDDIESKGSVDSLADLDRLYGGFDEEDRIFADEVLSEWILSDREDKPSRPCM